MSNFASRLQRELDRPHRSRFQLWARWLLIPFFCVALPLLGAEIYLRLSGFYRPRLPLAIQARTNAASVASLNARFESDAFVPDQFLLWKLKPGSNIYGIPINRERLLGDLPTRQRPDQKDYVRLLCLGDSTAAVVYRTFPNIAQRLIERASTEQRIEIINAAVAGYTSEQGLRWYQQLRPLGAKVVLLSFGWNDMFPALNLPDKELGARNEFWASLHRLFRRTRIYQFIAAPADERRSSADVKGLGLRVSPDDFRENLVKLVRQIRTDGATPLLATQPENLTPASSAYFASLKYVSTPEALAALHRRYTTMIREVASQESVPLLDAEEEFQRRNREFLFEPDGIHLSPAGHNFVARLLVGALRNQNFITEKEFEQIVNVARYDSTAPDKPRAAWVVDPPRVDATTETERLSVSVLARNSGNTTFLRSHVIPDFGTQKNVSYGSVGLTGKWKTTNAPTTDTVARTPLSYDLLPGESTSTTLDFKTPQEPGAYIMEIGLEADKVGPLEKYGTETTTLTVTVRP